MISILQIRSPNNIMESFLTSLENLCEIFNKFFVVFFIYLKFIFVLILFSIGILTLTKLRGIYRIERTELSKNDAEGENQLKKPRLLLGTIYIFMAFGILFNYFTYFLIIILEPLPDRLIFDFVSFSGDFDTKYTNRIEDINAAKYPHEKTIYYCVAMMSFGAILDVVISIYSIVNNKEIRKKTFKLLFGGIVMGILAGWTTCLPLFL